MMKLSRRLGTGLQSCSDKHLNYFHNILPSNCIQTHDLDTYNQDWLKFYKGNSKLVLKPFSSDQVSQILAYCNQQKIPVVPQGGNTGLAGGAVPVNDEIILSLKNLNKIEKIDETQGIVWTEAGVVLETLNNFCSDKGWIVPLDLASKGSCFIGGNVATNAGGIRYLRYGSLHGNVLGLEVVLPNGEILSDLKGLRKDNTGYDYKQLFIGSEGSLGVITKVALLLAPKPKSVITTFLACDSYEKVVLLLKKAKDSLGEILSTYEFIDSTLYNLLIKHIPNTRNPFSDSHNFYILIETSGSNSIHDTEKMSLFLEDCFESKNISDGIIAADLTQADNIWKIRESSVLVTKHLGKHEFQFDISLRIPELYKFVENIRERIGDKGFVLGYGHLADGNLHLAVAGNDEFEIKKLLFPFIYEEVERLKGSVSAEHGIGLFKKGLIRYSKDENSIKYMVKTI